MNDSMNGAQSHCTTEIRFVNFPRALNNRFILEAYSGDRSLKARETNGFAMLSQKINLVGLKLLADTQLSDGTWIPKGFTAYLKEELLIGQAWAKANMECAAIQGKFMIVDAQYIEFVTP